MYAAASESVKSVMAHSNSRGETGRRKMATDFESEFNETLDTLDTFTKDSEERFAAELGLDLGTFLKYYRVSIVIKGNRVTAKRKSRVNRYSPQPESTIGFRD